MAGLAKTRFSEDPTTKAISRLDTKTNQWVPSDKQQVRVTREQEKRSSQTTFQRGRAAFIKGMTTPFFGPKDTPGSRRGKAFLNFAVAETPGGAAADVALALASFVPGAAAFTGPALLARRGGKVVKGVKALQKTLLGTPGKALATRAVAPGIAAGVTSAATGTDPVEGAIIGGLTAVTELGGPPVRATSRFITRLTRQSKILERGAKDAVNVAERIRQAIPPLKKVLPKGNGEALTILTKPDEGRKALGAVFDDVENAAAAALGKDDKGLIRTIKIRKTENLATSSGLRATPGGKGLVPTAEVDEVVTLPQLFQKVKDLKNDARRIPRDQPILKRQLQAQATKMEGNLKNVLGQLDNELKGSFKKGAQVPSLVKDYNAAVGKFRDGLPILDVMKKALDKNIIEETAGGTVIHLGEFAKLLNRSKVSTKKFPGLFATSQRGAGRGRADVIKKLTGRAIVPRAGAFNFPLPSLVERAGFKRIPSSVAGPAQLPTSLGAIRLGEQFSSNPTGGR